MTDETQIFPKDAESIPLVSGLETSGSWDQAPRIKPEYQPAPRATKFDPITNYPLLARRVIVGYVNAHLDPTDTFKLTEDQVFVVQFAKVLQNWKALVSTTLPDGMYYELTFNGDKNELYVDAYKRWNNVWYAGDDLQQFNY